MVRSRRDRAPSPVTVANENVSITMVCRLVGMDIPEDLAYGRNVKVWCPFGDVYHTDGGDEAAMRIYVESNSVYCFAGCGYFTPVSLAAHAWDLTRRAAARELLDRAGIVTAAPASVWQAALPHDEPVDHTLLAEALKTFCRRTVPGWERRQFEPEPAALLTRCLSLLDQVVTDEDARHWLSGCKRAVAARLSESTHH